MPCANPAVELTGSAAETRQEAKAEVLSLLKGSPREASHPGPEVPAAWVPLFLSEPLTHCHFLAEAHTLLVDGHGPPYLFTQPRKTLLGNR